MSVYRSKKSAPYYWFDFQIAGNRFHGTTKCTSRKEAEKVEATHRERAKAQIKATKLIAGSMQIEHVADRYWGQIGKHHAGGDTTFRDLNRLVDHFGANRLLVEITDPDVARLVALAARAAGCPAEEGQGQAGPGPGGPLGGAGHRQSLDHRSAQEAVHLRQGRGRPVRPGTSLEETLVEGTAGARQGASGRRGRSGSTLRPAPIIARCSPSSGPPACVRLNAWG